MDCFDNFDPLTGDVPAFPFYELWSVVDEARTLLAGVTDVGVRNIERDLDDFISETKSEMASDCLDEHIARVIDEASWELSYLPECTAPTPQNVRQLFEDWPEDAEKSDYLTEDDFSDVEMLRMVISYGGLGRLGSTYSYPVHCAAVLALMKSASCIETLKCPEEDLGTHEDGPIAARLVAAANNALDAALILGYARELAAVAATQAEVAEEFKENNAETRRQFSAERARDAAIARHRHFKPAIEFVQTEWNEHREAYEFNKTDFARTYVELVRKRYRDKKGDPLKVTIKTITDVWLAPTASKRAGKPVEG